MENIAVEHLVATINLAIKLGTISDTQLDAIQSSSTKWMHTGMGLAQIDHCKPSTAGNFPGKYHTTLQQFSND